MERLGVGESVDKVGLFRERSQQTNRRDSQCLGMFMMCCCVARGHRQKTTKVENEKSSQVVRNTKRKGTSTKKSATSDDGYYIHPVALVSYEN